MPPPVTAVGIDAAGRSFRFTTCHCLSMRGLYPRPWVSSVLTARDAHTSAAGVPRGITPTPCVVCTDPSGRSIIVCSLYLLEFKGSTPPSPVVVFVNTAGSLIQVLCTEISCTDTCECRL